MTAQKRRVAIIKFPGITRDEARSIERALRKEARRMGIVLFFTNVEVETMSREEFLSAVKRTVFGKP